MNIKKAGLLMLILGMGMGCSQKASSDRANMDFSSNNGGISLPDGFKAVVVSDSVGSARHIVIDDDGDMYVALSSPHNGKGIVALRDSNNDGVADETKYFGNYTGSGIGLHNGFLYFSTDTSVIRYKMNENELVPASDPEVIVHGFLKQSQHQRKAFTFDNNGHIYVNVGAPANSCQEKDRTKESPGREPCPLLDRHAGIWQFSATQRGQTQQQDGHRYATGLRNVVGIDWNNDDNTLYVMQHGRDQLYQNWPDYYTVKQGAELPAEEFFRVHDGDNFGWPYSYYDEFKNKIMLAPEYGGDGKKTIAESRFAGKFEEPIEAFPGHWGPNDLRFYTGDQFPEKYRGGAFIAFHGSWNRAPEPQEGFRIAFVPFENNKTAGDYETFANGFKGSDSDNAEYRPMGLSIGPDGSLYITETQHGKIWRIVYMDNS